MKIKKLDCMMDRILTQYLDFALLWTKNNNDNIIHAMNLLSIFNHIIFNHIYHDMLIWIQYFHILQNITSSY
jgi:hypothetical protein